VICLVESCCGIFENYDTRILLCLMLCCSYLQGVLVFLAAKSGFIKDAKAAADFQNFIVCVEMLLAAAGHFFAFPYKEYAGANIGNSSGLTGSLAHAVKLNDVYHDTVHQVSHTFVSLWSEFFFPINNCYFAI